MEFARRRFNHCMLQALGLSTWPALSLAQSQNTGNPKNWKRIALVIGNAKYGEGISTLPSPERDAEDVASMLSDHGFIVSRYKNLPAHMMRSVIANFGLDVKKQDTFAVFFFSGHGAAGADGGEYLMPVDARGFGSPSQDGIPVFQLLQAISPQRDGHTLAILDSCRNFVPPAPNVIGKNLNIVATDVPPLNEAALRGTGTTVMYAAGLNQKAIDQWNRNRPTNNSMYTHFFLQRVKRNPNESLADLFDHVASEVKLATLQQVTPGLYNEGGGLANLRFGGVRRQQEDNYRRTVGEEGGSFDIFKREQEKRPCPQGNVSCLEKKEPPAPSSYN